jgi:L-cysteine/cystine lyase
MQDLAPPLFDLETHRQSFSALHNKLYFNYGGQGPLPKAALDAILESYQLMQQEAPFLARPLTLLTLKLG